MKRFVAAAVEDREFEIGGEVFRWVYPYWEDIANVFDSDAAEISEADTDALSVRDTIADFIDRIELFIDADFNDGKNRWKALTKRKKNPIPHSQYSELYRYLLEETSRPHPTEQPSPSEDGQPPIVTTSTGGSS